MTDMAFSSAYELIAALKSKQISSLELTDLYINRIEKFDGDINAVVVRDFEKARDAAKVADEATANNIDFFAGLEDKIEHRIESQVSTMW
jgi:Asp-tRNA(Asn)/Glu-tRNA(Gln) amidotransferase A subunit family amidase